MQSYVSKVSSAGQVTLPKRVRENLGLSKDSYIVLDMMGNAVLVRKLEADRDTLARIRARVRRSGLSRNRVQQIVEGAVVGAWQKEHAESLRRR